MLSRVQKWPLVSLPAFPQQRLCFRPDLQGQGALRRLRAGPERFLGWRCGLGFGPDFAVALFCNGQ